MRTVPSHLRRIVRLVSTRSSARPPRRNERDQRALESARWVSSWMMPWERAHMDAQRGPLTLWERVYWRLFVVLGGVGFAYETWVLGNRGLWKEEKGTTGEMVAGTGVWRSERMLSDEEVDKRFKWAAGEGREI